MTHGDHAMNTTARHRVQPGVGALWASAFVLAALVVVQAGRLGAGAQARADVSSVGELTILTSDTGNREDIVFVMDARSDALLIYGVENRNRVELYQNIKLTEFFTQARNQRAPGGFTRPGR